MIRIDKGPTEPMRSFVLIEADDRGGIRTLKIEDLEAVDSTLISKLEEQVAQLRSDLAWVRQERDEALRSRDLIYESRQAERARTLRERLCSVGYLRNAAEEMSAVGQSLVLPLAQGIENGEHLKEE